MQAEQPEHEDWHLDDPAVRAMWEAAFLEGNRGERVDEILDQLLVYGVPWDVDLQGISVPTLLWSGELDEIVPEIHGRALLEQLPDGRLTTWPGEGHSALLRRWLEVVDELLQVATLD